VARGSRPGLSPAHFADLACKHRVNMSFCSTNRTRKTSFPKKKKHFSRMEKGRGAIFPGKCVSGNCKGSLCRGIYYRGFFGIYLSYPQHIYGLPFVWPEIFVRISVKRRWCLANSHKEKKKILPRNC
jgi:hypothetical protein